jgi:hypothetical protein
MIGDITVRLTEIGIDKTIGKDEIVGSSLEIEGCPRTEE